MLVRITKQEARKLFAQGKAIYLCPCKMRPEGPFSVATLVNSGKDWLERADRMMGSDIERKESIRWDLAWDLMYKNWEYYNANNECGRYAHYYIDRYTTDVGYTIDPDGSGVWIHIDGKKNTYWYPRSRVMHHQQQEKEKTSWICPGNVKPSAWHAMMCAIYDNMMELGLID